MRALRLAAALIAAILTASLASPAGAALPQLALACAPAQAGQDAACTLSRLSGGRGVYLLFQTSDGTAKAGLDYSAVSKQIYLPASSSSATVAVHTMINPAATGTLTFNAAVAGGATVVRAAGTIVEPAPLPPPPPPATQTCPDGSVIPAASICPPPAPAPSPTPSWVPAPLTVGGYAFVKGSTPTQVCCSGLIIRIVGANADGSMWQGMFYSDVSGNFPANNAYWATAQMWFDPGSIAGVAPAP